MDTSTIARLPAHKHHWILEPATQTKPSPFFGDGDCDGELYTERYTRGNIEGVCKDCGERRTFHPFTYGLSLTRSYAPVQDPMAGAAPVEHGIPEGEAPAATLA
jgi:hypothetical protein